MHPHHTPVSPSSPSLRDRRDRQGSYAYMLVFVMPVLLGMGAVAVDLSYQKVVRAELQGAADIAAAAGTELLDGTAEGMDAARDAAIRAASRNLADGRPVELTADQIDFGSWDPRTLTYAPTTDPAEADAMRVTLIRDDVPATFASIMSSSRDIRALGRSVATQPEDSPAGKVSCYLPLAVASCVFDTLTEAELNEHTFVLNPAGIDNVGWGRISGSPNASWVRDQISDCHQDGPATVGDTVGLGNGEQSTDLFELARAIEDSATTWRTDEWGPIPAQLSQSRIHDYGNTLEGPILVFDGGADYCDEDGGSFNGDAPLLGFVWAVVYDVRTAGGAANKNIRVKLDSFTPYEFGIDRGGLVDAGVIYDEPVKIVE